MKLCKFLQFPDSLEYRTASTTSSFGDKVLAFASDILAERIKSLPAMTRHNANDCKRRPQTSKQIELFAMGIQP